MSPASKRRKLVPDDEAEEDLDTILARIQEQESSEALGRQLEAEWNGTSSASTSGSSAYQSGSSKIAAAGDEEVIVIDDREVIIVDDDSDNEDDEAMARRLAREWDEQEELPSLSVTSSSSRPEISSIREVPPLQGTRADYREDIPPNEKLLEFRPMFVSERSCPKCNAKVKSPRGYVRCRLY